MDLPGIFHCEERECVIFTILLVYCVAEVLSTTCFFIFNFMRMMFDELGEYCMDRGKAGFKYANTVDLLPAAL